MTFSAPIVERTMHGTDATFASWAEQFIVDGNRAEVLMVSRGATGNVWLQRKQVWRLPSGTINPGEDPIACVERETDEEFGRRLEVVRNLAIMKLKTDAPGVTGSFTSYIFLLDCGRHIPRAKDLSEGISGWRAVPISTLYAEAQVLRKMQPDQSEHGWRLPYWGTFRAIEHELVAELLHAQGDVNER